MRRGRSSAAWRVETNGSDITVAQRHAEPLTTIALARGHVFAQGDYCGVVQKRPTVDGKEILSEGGNNLMRADERRIYFFDLTLKKLGKSSHAPPLLDVLEVWKEHFGSKTAFHSRQSGDVLYLIGDMKIDLEAQTATMLISVIDRAMADAAYGHLDTRETRIIKKGDREGGHLSAHLVISLTALKANTHLCLLEGMRHLSASSIQFLLNAILRKDHKVKPDRFTYPDPSGAKTKAGLVRRLPYLPLVDLGGHPSEMLIEEIENGIIRHLNFIQTREQQPFSDDPYLEEAEFQLKVTVKQSIPHEKRWERIVKAIKSKKAEFSHGRISFIDSNQATRNVEFDTENATIDNTQFVKFRVITKIDPPLAEGIAKIAEHLESRMVSLLQDDQKAGE